jgi:methionyl-tRNA formyltransferase
VLDVPRYGAINIHASLLPRWRGAAPIQRALLAGDSQTGISIMQMDAGLDTGPVLARRSVPIRGEDDAGSLHDALAELGGRMIVEVLAKLHRGELKAEAQSEAGACYASKIDKRETVIDWRRPAEELERMVRAFRPVPGATTHLEGEPIKLWRASVTAGAGAPGALLRVSDEALVVACGREALAVSELQRPGGRRLLVDAFLRGRRLIPGMTLGAPQA